MKYLILLLTAVIIVVNIFAQAPEKLSYQAVVRNSNEQLITNTLIGIQISIIHGDINESPLYTETQKIASNQNGLISLEIGNGVLVSGSFASIDWSNGPYFIQSKFDIEGGSNYSISGTSQLLSVPYALHAKTAETVLQKSSGIQVLSNSEIANLEPVIGEAVFNTTLGLFQIYIDNSWLSFSPILNGNPEVITLAATEITWNTAILNGRIKVNGGALVTQKGFYWSQTNHDPNQNDNVETISDANQNLSVQLVDLEPQTTYFFRAFATNENGTSLGSLFVLTTLNKVSEEISFGSFIDSRDNKGYNTVQIGEQVWMRENLAYLPSVSPSENQSYTDPVYYVNGYQGNNTNEAKETWSYKELGVLYNWKASTNACPSEWHLPSVDDWEELAEYISEDNGGYTHTNDIWQEVGKHLKANYSWVDFVTGPGTDTYGFKANASGYRKIYDGGFYFLNENVFWWSATEQEQNSSYYYALFYDQDYLLKYPEDKMYGYSVRCVKD